jgi:hypothetical protein
MWQKKENREKNCKNGKCADADGDSIPDCKNDRV